MESDSDRDEEKQQKSATSPTLRTQLKLRRHGVGYVKDRYKLTTRFHKKHPNLVLLKYNQITSPFGEEVVRECRGLVVDMDDDFRVVSYPYKKFFNYGEKWAAPIDWSSAKVYEKLDGSLVTLYWYRDEWHVSSSGVPDASANLDSCGMPFAHLFWRIWEERGLTMPTDTGKCYMFEMLSLDNIIVNRPEKDDVILHGVREIATLIEVEPEPIAEKYGWPVVKTLPYGKLEDVLNASKRLNPAHHEGFVVRDKNFNRVKVKAPQYVALSLMNVYDTKNLNYNHMTKIIRAHEDSEFLAYFPMYEVLYRVVRFAFDTLVTSLKQVLETIQSKYPGTNPPPHDVKKVVEKNLKDISPPLLQTYLDICLNVLRSEVDVAVGEVLETWPIDDLVRLLHAFHGPEQQILFSRYKESRPTKKKRVSAKNAAVGIATSNVVQLEYDFEEYEKPSIRRARMEREAAEKARLEEKDRMARLGGIKKGAKVEKAPKKSAKQQRKEDEEFEAALRDIKQMDDEKRTVHNYNPPPKTRKEQRQLAAQTKRNQKGRRR